MTSAANAEEDDGKLRHLKNDYIIATLQTHISLCYRETAKKKKVATRKVCHGESEHSVVALSWKQTATPEFTRCKSPKEQ